MPEFLAKSEPCRTQKGGCPEEGLGGVQEPDLSEGRKGVSSVLPLVQVKKRHFFFFEGCKSISHSILLN